MPGTHQHAAAEGVALAHTIHGSPVQGTNGVTHAHGDIQLAGLHSTAPYKPPKRRDKDNPKRELCPMDGCKAFPTKATGYCVGHSRQLDNDVWKKDDPDDDDR